MVELRGKVAGTKEALLMEPCDWQKFDGPSPPGSGYFYFLKSLGDVQGKRILEAGCGTGWLSVILAKRGAYVHGFDISHEFVQIARQRAKVNGVENKISFELKSIYNMDKLDENFDLVVGCAILHHVNIKKIIGPLQKVLKQEGKAVFIECLGNSMWLERLRLLVPVPIDDKDKLSWKKQLKYSDMKKFQRGFAKVSWREFELFARLDRVVKNETFISFLHVFDEAVFRFFSGNEALR